MDNFANLDSTALLVIDVQKGFDEEDYWGPRDNPDCEANIESSSLHGGQQVALWCLSATTR